MFISFINESIWKSDFIKKWKDISARTSKQQEKATSSGRKANMTWRTFWEAFLLHFIFLRKKPQANISFCNTIKLYHQMGSHLWMWHWISCQSCVRKLRVHALWTSASEWTKKPTRLSRMQVELE